LREESSAWVAEGLVTAAQREALLARHPESGPARLPGILGAVGGALVLAGVCLLIGSNWERIGAFAKIAGVILLIATPRTALAAASSLPESRWFRRPTTSMRGRRDTCSVRGWALRPSHG
jgi:hypothetical protein